MQRTIFWMMLLSMFSYTCYAGTLPPKKLNLKPHDHPAALNPNDPAYLIPYPGYLIGMEKERSARTGKLPYKNCEAGERYCFSVDNPFFLEKVDGTTLKKEAEKRLNDPNPHFITHIVRYDHRPGSDNAESWKGSSLYNIYSNDRLVNGQIERDRRETDYIRQSWDLLTRSFYQDLRQRVMSEGTTHILVYTTGWNTQEKESIANFRDWNATLRQAYEEYAASRKQTGGKPIPFKPMFIGLSWSSDGTRQGGAVDYLGKAHEADEVGMTWGNLLVNKVLRDVKEESGVKIVLIGHSFGARLLTRAVNSSPMIVPATETMAPVDLVIGLQGAFSYQRFVKGEGKECSPYRNYSKQANKWLFTCSDKDKAVDAAPVAKIKESAHMGDKAAYNETKSRKIASFEHLRLTQAGSWDAAPNMRNDSIAYFEGSSVINTNKPGMAGLAHSDVYDLEIGRFVWQAIERYAEAPAK